MNSRKPPSSTPPPVPRFETYRPSEERGGGAQGYPQQQGAQNGYPPRPQRPAPMQQAAGPRYGQQPMRPPVRPPQMRAAGGPPGGEPPRRRGGGPLKFIFYTLMFLLLLAGGGVAFLLYAMPTDFIRDQMIAQVKAKTGRELKIAGPTSFTIYPSIGLSMKDVSLSAPPGMAAKPLVTMAALDASVKLMPLLKREVELERLVLRQPVFNLEVDKQGKKSWDFAAGEAPAAVRYAQAGAPASDAPGGLPSDAAPQAAPPAAAPQQPMSAERLKTLEQVRLGDVRIEDGTLHYADQRTGSSQDAKSINVRLGMLAISQPLDAKGDLVWKGQKIDFDSKLTSVKTVLEDRPAKLALNVKSAPLAASFDGTVAVKDALDLEGAVTANSPSARALAKWFGAKLPVKQGFGALEAKGQLRLTDKVVALSNADVGLDGAKATGQVSVETSGERPYVKANLKLSVLDLNTYLGDGTSSPAAPEPKTAPAKPAAGDAKGEAGGAKSINDLLDADKGGAKVKGYTKRAGWSNEPIDLDGLGAVDADAKLSVGKLLYEDIKVGQSQLTVALKNKVLKTTFDEINLYKGKGRGFVTVDGTNTKSASVGANLSVEGIEAQPFLKDAADLEWLSGTAKITLAVAGQGASQKKIIDTLNGKSDVTFANGAISGINVPGMVRSVSQGKLGGLKTAPSEKTDFSEMSASFNIANGVAQNQDLKLVSPLLRVSGAGNVSLPARQVDYTIKPKLVADLQGQGGNDKLAGLEIPVRVKGPWDKLDYTPELGGILKDPNKALDAVKEIGKQFKGKDAGEIVKDLLGGNKGGTGANQAAPNGTATGSGAAQPQEKPPVKKLLDQFLNKPQ